MKELNDKELDFLIGKVMQRKQTREDLQASAMMTIQAERRKTTARRWLRAFAFAFGIASFIVIVTASAYSIITSEKSVAVTSGMIVFILSVAYCLQRQISDFSFDAK